MDFLLATWEVVFCFVCPGFEPVLRAISFCADRLLVFECSRQTLSGLNPCSDGHREQCRNTWKKLIEIEIQPLLKITHISTNGDLRFGSRNIKRNFFPLAISFSI